MNKNESPLRSSVGSPLGLPPVNVLGFAEPLPMVSYSVASGRSERLRDTHTGAACAGVDRPLGNNTESSSPPPTLNHPETLKRQGFRLDRYRQKTYIRNVIMHANGFLNNEFTDFEEYNKLPRVVKCVRTRCRSDQNVKLHKELQSGNAFYSGNHVCGSAWLCPTCSAKIEAKRRSEIQMGIESQLAKGKKSLFCTFTIPHTSGQSCSEVLANVTKALTRLRSGKVFDKFKKRVGFDGLIRSLEVTLGANGWHVHTHECWFVDSDVDENEFASYVADRWLSSCKKFGLIPRGKIKAFRLHGFKVGFTRSEYMAKFDSDKYVKKLAAEISLSGVKHGRDGSLHPFQLAELAFSGGRFDKMAVDLFMDYAKSFKGKSRIFWSRGLKDRCGINEKTDQELSEEISERAFEICEFEPHGFSRIVKENAQAVILNLVENGGRSAVDLWFEKFPENPI